MRSMILDKNTLQLKTDTSFAAVKAAGVPEYKKGTFYEKGSVGLKYSGLAETSAKVRRFEVAPEHFFHTM